MFYWKSVWGGAAFYSQVWLIQIKFWIIKTYPREVFIFFFNFWYQSFKNDPTVKELLSPTRGKDLELINLL